MTIVNKYLRLTKTTNFTDNYDTGSNKSMGFDLSATQSCKDVYLAFTLARIICY